MSNLIRTALGSLLVLFGVTAASAQQLGQAPQSAPSSSAPVQGFSVVLVLGSLGDNTQKFAADLPRGATRALTDLTDFLPYRSYRLLDSAWILSPGAGHVTSRMRGTDNRAYEVGLDVSAVPTSKVGVRFALRDAGDGGTKRAADLGAADQQAYMLTEAAQLKTLLAALEGELVVQQKVDAGQPDAEKKRNQVQEVKRRLDVLNERQKRVRLGLERGVTSDDALAARIIDTGFTMDVGETVVVGTSRLQGDTALIVLLTAVPRVSK